MSSDLSYVQFVADQLSSAGAITYKKMFGEYGVYCDGKYFAVICDNRFLVKITQAGRELMPDCRTELPYEGGSPMFFIENLDDREFLKELTVKTCAELLKPKAKKAKIAQDTGSKKLDYKKEYKDLYLPAKKPSLIDVPEMHFIMVKGRGAPQDAEYQLAIRVLYSLSFTVKMSKLSGRQPDGYFDYVVPPLEGLWSCGEKTKDYLSAPKSEWQWISIIRQPEFVTKGVFDWAVEECRMKKPEVDVSRAEFVTFTEGLCVQVMHTGSYDSEADSLEKMDDFVSENHLEYVTDGLRMHHEIYLSSPQRVKSPQNLKTVLRHPVKRQDKCGCKVAAKR